MNTYSILVGAKGEIILPPDLQELLGLVEGDTFEIRVDIDGKVYARGAERSPRPLADFFEDLILGDLQCEGCSGDFLRDQLYHQKIRLSTTLDRLAGEARSSQEQAIDWRKIPELPTFSSATRGSFKVVISTRAERDLFKLPESLIKKVPGILNMLELNPTGFKRLNGPYYSTYRVSFDGKTSGQYRVIYTVFEDSQVVSVLSIGERKEIYNWLKGLA